MNEIATELLFLNVLQMFYRNCKPEAGYEWTIPQRSLTMTRKKLMILGGSRYAVPVVEATHGLGLHVITAYKRI